MLQNQAVEDAPPLWQLPAHSPHRRLMDLQAAELVNLFLQRRIVAESS
jgi:hypothetical protein